MADTPRRKTKMRLIGLPDDGLALDERILAVRDDLTQFLNHSNGRLYSQIEQHHRETMSGLIKSDQATQKAIQQTQDLIRELQSCLNKRWWRTLLAFLWKPPKQST